SLLFAHAMTFLIGASVAFAPRERDTRWALILAMLGSAMLIVVRPQFVYPAASSMLIILCLYWRIHWRALALLVDCSYEYYLVHGIALVGTLVALKMPFVPGVTIGILSSGLVAIPLRRLSAAAAGLIDRAIGASYRGDLAESRVR